MLSQPARVVAQLLDGARRPEDAKLASGARTQLLRDGSPHGVDHLPNATSTRQRVRVHNMLAFPWLADRVKDARIDGIAAVDLRDLHGGSVLGHIEQHPVLFDLDL